MEDRHVVMKLTFANQLSYVREEGFRTPETTFPFKALSDFSGVKNTMARPRGFEPLASASGGTCLCVTLYFIIWPKVTYVSVFVDFRWLAG
jgi:hypothetical protein